MTSITLQPSKLAPFDLTSDPETDTKRQSHSHTHACSHRSRHNTLRARLPLLILSITLLVSLGLLLLLGNADDVLHGSMEGVSILKRQVSSPGNGNGSGIPSGNSPFVKNKLYLIVVIVGFFVVLLLAVMLSAWCCRGAFRNPLCCPCYLCACCGGLGESTTIQFPFIRFVLVPS